MIDLSRLKDKLPAEVYKDLTDVCIKYKIDLLKEEADIARNAIYKDILENIEDLDPEFSKVLDENFWELLEE